MLFGDRRRSDSFIMVKRKAGDQDHDETPLGECRNVNGNGEKCGHGGKNVVGVASPTKSPTKLNKTSSLRQPLSDCTNIISNGEKSGHNSEELAAKRQKENKKKRQYRGRVKADLENSVPDEELAAKRKKEAERKRQYRARKKAELESFVSPSIRSTVTNPTMVLGAIDEPCTMNNQTGLNHTALSTGTQATCDAVEVGNCVPVDVDDESWLHRNDDWRPSTSDGLQNVDNIECVTVDRVGVDDKQRAKWRDSTRRYRKQKQEQQNSAHLATASELKISRLQSANTTVTDEI